MLKWKSWQWMLIGLLLGLLMGYLYGEMDFTPRNADSRVDLKFFANQVHSPPIPGGPPRVSGVTLYPPHYGVQLVTFVSAMPGPSGPVVTRHFFYSQYGNLVQRLTQLNIPFSYAWWASPACGYALWCTGSTLLVGVAWPLLIRLLRPATAAEAEYDLNRFGGKPEETVTTTVATDTDLTRLNELDAAMEAALKQSPSTEAAGPPAGGPIEPPAVKSLDAGPLEPLAGKQAQEDKQYEGQYYPVSHPKGKPPSGFTLIELLVVIGIIGLLLGLLLPALSRARDAANQLTCAANLHSIGQGLSLYLVGNKGTYPPAYLYVGQTITNGIEAPDSPDKGYQHWSYYLYGNLGVAQTAFQCPSLDKGGLPPCNPAPGNFDPGQVAWPGGVVDQQAPRLAYTVNEAICPRNKLAVGYQAAKRIYQYVKASQVSNAGQTILATEWAQNATRLGDTVYSHRPISGFIGSDNTLDMYELQPGFGYRRTTAVDLDPVPASATASATRLDWVGRNHGRRAGYPDRRRSNFLYVDGHVETKTIYDTLLPFEWGAQFWSLLPHDDLISP